MESPKYKAINVNLDTRKMRRYGKYPIGYTEVKRIYLGHDKKYSMLCKNLPWLKEGFWLVVSWLFYVKIV